MEKLFQSNVVRREESCREILQNKELWLREGIEIIINLISFNILQNMILL